MRIQILGVVMGAALLIAPAVVLGAPRTQQAPESLRQIDRHYAQKSYGYALKGYQRLLNTGIAPAGRRADIRYRIGVCLGKTERWNQALVWSLDFVKQHRGTVWEPRGLYWLGRLYLGVPHDGWRVGDRIFRGQDVPQTAADARPEPVQLAQQDLRNAQDALEAARIFYPAYRAQAHTEAEEIQLDFDLARTLQENASGVPETEPWPPSSSPYWKIDPAAAYVPAWAPQKKILTLYAQIEMLAPRSPGGRRLAALALLGKALFLRAYRDTMQRYSRRWEHDRWTAIPYPYEDQKPEPLLRRLICESVGDPLRDEGQLILGRLFEQQSDYLDALREYRQLIARSPDSRWASDAHAALQEIRRRGLLLEIPGPELPGRVVRAALSFRNVKRVRFRIYRVDLAAVLGSPKWRLDPQRGVQQLEDLFPRHKAAPRRYGPLVASWERITGDRGDYRPRDETVTLPIKRNGAYVVEAAAPGVRSVGMIVLSDLMLIQKVQRDGSLLFAANAQTGAPVAGARILAKQFWQQGDKSRVAFTRVRTDGRGLATVPFQRAAGRSSFQMAALAVVGERYALTGEMQSDGSGDNAGTFRVYCSTDRAVYRPAQTIHYRELVMRRLRGRMVPVAGRPVNVTVTDPRDKVIFKRTATASAFGSVAGDFALSVDAPLGEYTVAVNLPGRNTEAMTEGGNQFRVEEYKKPEFEVTVTPNADHVRLGAPVSARIHAAYYFGGPAPGAKVTYRVYQASYSQSYRFPRPYDFLYGDNSAGAYNTDYRNGPVVAQGTARTDAKGDAPITVQTQENARRFPDQDLTYTVEADVQDTSRRTVSGTGAVKAMRHDVGVFLDFPHGYATQGDRVDVEVMTLNPSDQPVSVPGTAETFLQPETPRGKERLVWSAPLTTDAHGRGYIHWTARRAGYYRLAFVTRDTAGQKVSGDTGVWVEGSDLRLRRFLFQGLELKVRERYYTEGGTARVLLVAPEPGCTVLLTREANGEILGTQVVHLPGRSLEMLLPITAGDAPNVFLSAVMVRHGAEFAATQEIFVPPVRQFSTVTVQADKARYLPGEKAKLALRARDWQGRPLRTELCVSIADAALGYIQKDYAPDIRTYFYGDRRSQSVDTSASSNSNMSAITEDTQPRKNFRTHDLGLPEGMGHIPDWPEGAYHWVIGWHSPAMAGGGGPAGPMSGAGFGTHSGLPGAIFQGELNIAVNDRAFVGVVSHLPSGMTRRVQSQDYDTGLYGQSGAGEYRRWPWPAPKPEQAQAPTPRRKFLDTAFWTPAVLTDSRGNATVEVTWPDNLTQWRAVTTGNTATGQVGAGETRMVTKKDLLIRVQTPRFFVERDRIVLSADVHNYLPEAARVKVSLDLGGDLAEVVPAERKAAGDPSSSPAETWIDLTANDEKRIDWWVQVRRSGALRIRMAAQSASAADAAEMTVPVLVHGVERTVAHSGVLRAEKTATVAIDLPEARKPGGSQLVVRLDPSLAGVMLGALPYLADYPYGCIEQTMSRFLPAVVLAAALKDLGYNLNAARSLPGAKGNPVFDPGRLHRLTVEGLARIVRFQHKDGGWGWWPDDTSDPAMSAYVVDSLLLAQRAGGAVDAGTLQRGLDYLLREFREDDDLQRMASTARVLARIPRYRSAIRAQTTNRLFGHRERLSAYAKALLALALHDLGDTARTAILLRNLEGTATIDEANGTASWDADGDAWWRWYNDRAETNAVALQAYLEIAPKSRLAPMVMKWLVSNRHGSAWASTRETATVVLALAAYARAYRETAARYTLTVDLGGRVRRTYRVTPQNALTFDNTFVIADPSLRIGTETLTINKEGPGSCYYTVSTSYFSEEEPIHATGSELFVRRRYFRLLPGTASGAPEPDPLDPRRPNPFLTGRYELLSIGGEGTEGGDTAGGPRYERVALREGDPVTSGDLLEVELQLEAKNDYDYLLFEDRKPAGCEPMEVRSGPHSGGGLCSNMEFRDQKVAFFLDRLPQGTRTLTYRLRAEMPGHFHVLPSDGYALYAPDIRALSEETALQVREEGTLHAASQNEGR